MTLTAVTGDGDNRSECEGGGGAGKLAANN